MASGEHFTQGIPLDGTTSLTPSDIDTSTAGLELRVGRFIFLKKDTAPDSSDSPQWQQYIWLAPVPNGLRREANFFNGLAWQPLVTDIDLTQAQAGTLPPEAINTQDSNTDDVLTVVVVGLDKLALWRPRPVPYTIGAAGTFVRSDGTVGSFQFIQGEDVKSSSAGVSILPLISDGTGGSSFTQLPVNGLVTPSSDGIGRVKVPASRAAGAYASTIVNLTEIGSDTDLIGTHVPDGRIPKSNGVGGIVWVTPASVTPADYQTPSPLTLSSLSPVTLGDYRSLVIDSIAYTTQAPVLVQAWLVCLVGEFGYAVGDRLPIAELTDANGNNGAWIRLHYGSGVCTVKMIYYGNETSDLTTDAGTISLVALTATRWQIVVTAHKL